MSSKDKKEWVDWLSNVKVLQKAVVADSEGNLLALRRAAHGPGKRLDKWDLPGGSVGPEDLKSSSGIIEKAIAREVFEETGLEVVKAEPIHITSWAFERSVGTVLGIAIGHSCLVKGVRPKVVLSDEHHDFTWLSKKEVLELDFGEDGGLHKDIVERA